MSDYTLNHWGLLAHFQSAWGREFDFIVKEKFPDGRPKVYRTKKIATEAARKYKTNVNVQRRPKVVLLAISTTVVPR